jgi:ABC-type sulfate transport system permease subunit
MCGLVYLLAWHNAFKSRSLVAGIAHLPFQGSIILCMWIYHILFAHSSLMDIWVVSHPLAIMNAAMNIHEQVLSEDVFICLECIPKTGITRSYGNGMANLLRN